MLTLGKTGGAIWECPECAGDDDAESDSEAESTHEEAEVNGDAEDGEISPGSTRRSTASKIARDLLPSHRGVNKPDSHSVFNHLVLDDDPMDGSRVLRKRKTSSAADIDEEVISLRKRRKNTSESIKDETSSPGKTNGADEAVRPRSARSLRLKSSNSAAGCTVVKKSRQALIIKLRVPSAELRQILSQKPKPKKRAGRAAASRPARSNAAARMSATAEPPMAPFMPSSYTQPFYSFYDKETDELKGKPYGGILTEAEADTSKTLPTKDDRRRFDEAKQKADEEWRNRLLAVQAEMEVPLKKSKKNSGGPASQIECIEFGGWEIDTWYAAPYPEEYSRNRVLYICEFCLKYMNSDYVAWRHKLKCPAKHPPGDEIYRHGSVSFFEVDGRKHPVYCQNLCLLAKLFLGSKTLYYDVEPFLFYVLCEYDDLGYHFVGYFSKEKRASSQNNVSCILTLPIHQRKGYGNLLIDFSYLLTRAEEKTGSPEKPLSDMGLVSYRNYWRLVMCKYLLEHTPNDKYQKNGLSIRQISDDTGMMPDDVISALEGLRCLVRDPQTQLYAFRVDLPFCREYVTKWEAKSYVKLNEKALTWTPYVMGRSNATNFELGPALTAIAPREEDEESKPVPVLVESRITTGDFGDADDSGQKALVDIETTVLESTEPNDNVVIEPQEDIKPNGVDKENDHTQNGTQVPEVIEPTGPAPVLNSADAEDEWQAPYSHVPVVRFEVFPPINPKRPGPSRMNSSIARPALVRAPATVPRPRVRRSVGGSTRKSASRPKSNTARRKTGGTGRGPGRWPKGTKKSDYGNADSGPGLPPGWMDKQRSSLGASKSGTDNDTKDTVQVKQPKGKSAKKGSESRTTSARFESKPDDAPPEASSDEESSDEKGDGDPDVVMGEDDEEDEDEDAEGEDE
jgi:histone acetyltransferase SAS3